MSFSSSYCPPLSSNSSSLLSYRFPAEAKDVIPPHESVIWDPPLELGLAMEGVDAPNQKITGEQKEELLEFQPMLKLPAQLKDLKVKVSHVNSPSSVYVQLTQCNTQLNRSAAKTWSKNPVNKPNIGIIFNNQEPELSVLLCRIPSIYYENYFKRLTLSH